MTRPSLRRLTTTNILQLLPSQVMMTMSEGQWDAALQSGYEQGFMLLELNDNDEPVAAYQKAQPPTAGQFQVIK